MTLTLSTTAQAFCGFYVAKADTSLFNRASQVVLVRDGNRTVITMANDFEGDVSDFAVVVPVPTFIERGQINVGDKSVIDHLDAYTSPRLVEYFDPDPCTVYMRQEMSLKSSPSGALNDLDAEEKARSQGVTIEASYTVGEYDILILSAEESDGLIRWLNDNGYRIPRGAERVVGSYLKQDMRFFVARVNLEEQKKSGYAYLRPLQVAYESNKFMLPIRLGTLNAKQQQDLYLYALTRTGRIETTNYRTIRLPSNTEVPEFVQAEFADFYRAMFARQTEAADSRGVFLEYACSRRPDVPGNGRSPEFSGTLCDTTSLEGTINLRYEQLRTAGAAASGTRGTATRQPDGLGHRRYPRENQLHRGRDRPAEGQALVDTAVGLSVAGGSDLIGAALAFNDRV
jgi:hypothetical protein